VSDGVDHCRPEVVEAIAQDITNFLESTISDESPAEIISAIATLLSRTCRAVLIMSLPEHVEMNRITLEKTLMDLWGTLNKDGNTGGVRH
jgi:molybdopterin biosynthesis enzyme MoaB